MQTGRERKTAKNGKQNSKRRKVGSQRQLGRDRQRAIDRQTEADKTDRQKQSGSQGQTGSSSQIIETVPCWVPAENKQTPKHVRLSTVTVNQTCVGDLKDFSRLR